MQLRRVNTTIERYIPVADRGKRHEVVIQAPADLVFDVAEHFAMQSIPVVRALFWLRAKILRAHYRPMSRGLVEETLAMGWGRLACTAGRELVIGCVTQPWVGDVRFRSVSPDAFAAFAEPGLVKIAWTIEAEPLGPQLSRFSTETRVQATDPVARKKFRSYWRKFGIGIVLIRWFLLPAVKKEAERRYRSALPAPTGQ